jgi:hypothetical protein
MLSEGSNLAGRNPNRSYVSDEIPPLIRKELNADMNRDLPARMRGLARKKRTLRREITEDEMADYLRLPENFQNLPEWLSERRSALQAPVRATVAWLTATVIILGFLTAMLIVAIAIAV